MNLVKSNRLHSIHCLCFNNKERLDSKFPMSEKMGETVSQSPKVPSLSSLTSSSSSSSLSVLNTSTIIKQGSKLKRKRDDSDNDDSDNDNNKQLLT
jgi:hypothetical protein